tara:strand:+ start:1107 stop:1502 length:396 start_codon:yes stop_codon:yes gene_type:complete
MNAGDVSRKRDYIYRLLVSNDTSELMECKNSILNNYVSEHGQCHPTLKSMGININNATPAKQIVLSRALVLFCMSTEPSFQQYLMDHGQVNNACLSQFVCNHLPKHAKQLLDGTQSLEDFVTNATGDYICG